ncbi:MAG TPA: DUF424 family protein [Candidatus Saccharimonadales bacterium]|nr:DUF424 family protein [Candidatus Saccharimonadales bacterium]
MNEVFLKIFKDDKNTLVAVCDTGLIGETFREGKLKLEVKPGFYQGVTTTIEEALRVISAADIVNLVGKRIVDAALNAGLVSPSAVISIAGVKHVQIVRI